MNGHGKGPGGGFKVLDGVAVASQAVVYSYAQWLGFARGVSLQVRAGSANGTSAVKVEWESSFKKPATELAADSDFIVPTNMTTPWASLAGALSTAPGAWAIQQVQPPKSEYGRLKVTGNASNAADTVVTALLYLDEGP